MRKTKVLIGLILAVMMVILPLNYSEAYEGELDENNLISFPMRITNGSGKITISSSETGYTLYYQAMEMTSEDYEEYNNIYNDGKKELETLKEKFDEAEEKYKEERNKENVDATAQEEAYAAYEEAYNNYNDKVNEINSKLKALIPTYNDSNWIKTEDGSFKIDTSTYSGEKAYVLWAKLVLSNGDIAYDEAIYSANGTKVDDDDDESNGNNTPTNGTTTNETPTNGATTDKTVATKKLAQTGEKSIIFIVAGLVILTIVLYKKFSDLKLK